MSKVMLKVEVEEDYLKSIKASTNKTSSDIILINATPLTESDDVVSRQEAIHCVTETELYNETFAEAKMRIAELKPVLPKREQGEWISVSERLPEKNVWVLVTVEQSDKRYQEIMRRHNYIEAWTDNIDIYTDEIIAWTPLPEPYKAESEDI